VALTPDMGWEVDVFGMPILDTVLRNQQVGVWTFGRDSGWTGPWALAGPLFVPGEGTQAGLEAAK